jgi:hypothetical protein
VSHCCDCGTGIFVIPKMIREPIADNPKFGHQTFAVSLDLFRNRLNLILAGVGGAGELLQSHLEANERVGRIFIDWRQPGCCTNHQALVLTA